MRVRFIFVVLLASLMLFVACSPATTHLVSVPDELEVRKADGKVVLQQEVPILMYHSISDMGGPWAELCVSESDFQAQLDYLVEAGYHTITLQELYQHWETNKVLPTKPIVITFDDGYRDSYTAAYPLMAAVNYRGVIFPYVTKLQSNKGIIVEELKELVAAGWEVGSHTYSHPDLTTLSDSECERELTESRQVLSDLTGFEVTSLCYPAGRFNDAVVNTAALAGYDMAVTTKSGMASYEQYSLLLKRIRVNRSDSLSAFDRKLQN